MSRIGKLPITIPTGVTIDVASNNVVTVKGPKGTLTQKVDPEIGIAIEEGVLTVTRPSEQKRHRALHGLYRSLISNMVFGVNEGYTISQELVGVGYKATNNGQILDLTLGYSHEVALILPEEVKVVTLTEKGKNPVITLTSSDKQLIGAVAAKIRSLRKPEPYKGKGIRFVGEVVRRKAGKTAGK
ncbi:MAG: 50S ribosomal protein L6 [Bacteroidota bacterium]|nr:50S ribosomal protein L6 [Bacteroidota bacterium]